MKYLYLVTLILISCKETSKTNVKDNNPYPVFYIYGELALENYIDNQSQNSITEKYGFRVKRIAYCEVDTIDIDSTHKHNKTMLEIMNKTHGKNWKKTFEKETGYILLIQTG